MKVWRRLRHWVRTWRTDDLRDEIEAHRAMLQADLEARGMPPADAAAASRRAMGNATLAREDAREVWIVGTADRLWRDVRHGLRGLRREPAFTAATLLTLAVGVATVSTSFSVADAELWKPLPYPDHDRLVAVYATGGQRAATEYISGPDFLEWSGSRAFARMAGIGESRRRVLRGETAEQVLATAVTWNYFATLGREALWGRTFAPEDASQGGVILTESSWRRLFGADPAIVGRPLTLDGGAVRVVGIVADDVDVQPRRDLFLPLDESSSGFLDRSARAVHGVIGRLQADVEPAAAEAELRTIAARLERGDPDPHRRGLVVFVRDLQEYYTGYNWRSLYFLLGASMLVLVLTCVNVAGLLLVRALRRGREFAIRGALGGGTGALVRQLAVEGALLAVPAGICAVLLSRWALAVLTMQVPPEYLVRGTDIPIDLRVGAFAFGVTALTAMVCAVVPALPVRRVDITAALAGGGRTVGAAPGRTRLRQGLIAAQAALTLVLLAAAGLFLRSYAALTQAPLGFELRGRAALNISLSGPRYAADAQIQDYARRLRERGLAVPGVVDAAVATSSPLTSGPAVTFAVAGETAPEANAAPRAIFRATSPGFFDLLGIPVLEGRAYSDDDSAGAPRVAVVNEVLARRMFPGGSAVGRTITLVPGARAPWTRRPGDLTIIGVVGNAKEIGIDEVEFNDIYVPFPQAPAPGLELIVRADIDPGAILRPLRDAAAGVDPDIPVGAAAPLERRVEAVLRGARFHWLLIGSFAMIAIVLAGIGIYGAVASAAHQRRREFGIRIALGARAAHVLTSALREPVRIGLAGAVAGIGVSLAAAAAIGDAFYLVPGQHNGLLFNVKTTDPIVLGSAATGVLALAVLAGAIPARRLARVDPLSVLREE